MDVALRGAYSEQENTISKILGSEWVQSRTKERAVLLHFLQKLGGSNDFQDKRKADYLLHGLGKIKRIQAYRLIACFPDPLICLERGEEEDFQDSKHFHSGVSAWLVNWEMDLCAGSELREMGLGVCEKYAQMSKALYELIRELCDRKLIPFSKPAFPWLLAEASKCRQRWGNAYRYSSRRDACDDATQYIALLEGTAKDQPDSITEFDTKTPENLDEMILHFASYIEAEGAKIADTGPYFRRYTKAMEVWNGAVRNPRIKVTLKALPKTRGLKKGRM